MADLDGLAFKKTYIAGRAALVASDLHAEEWLAKISDGAELIMSGRRPRNIKHHKKLFWILRHVINNTEEKWADEKALLHELKLATGLTVRRPSILVDNALPRHIQYFVDGLVSLADNPIVRGIPLASRLLTGSASLIRGLYRKTLEVHIPGSISFESMSQDRFDLWYENATHILATRVLHCEPQELRDAVIEMVGQDEPRPKRQKKEKQDGTNVDAQPVGGHYDQLDQGNGRLLGGDHQGSDGEGGAVLRDRAGHGSPDAVEEAEGRPSEQARSDT